MASYSMHLNSAASADIYTNNTLTDFTVQLPHTINVTGQKVALSEICFSANIVTIPEDNYIRIVERSYRKDFGEKVDILNSINEYLVKELDLKTAKFEYVNDHYRLKLPTDVKITPSRKMMNLFNMRNPKVTPLNQSIVLDYPKTCQSELLSYEEQLLKANFHIGDLYTVSIGDSTYNIMNIEKILYALIERGVFPIMSKIEKPKYCKEIYENSVIADEEDRCAAVKMFSYLTKVMRISDSEDEFNLLGNPHILFSIDLRNALGVTERTLQGYLTKPTNTNIAIRLQSNAFKQVSLLARVYRDVYRQTSLTHYRVLSKI